MSPESIAGFKVPPTEIDSLRRALADVAEVPLAAIAQPRRLRPTPAQPAKTERPADQRRAA